MTYVAKAHHSTLVPKLAGVYESEIQAWLEQLFTHRTDLLVDIGAAEGYYAVGAAFAGWAERVVAFETEPAARALLLEMMNANGIAPDRLELLGMCTPNLLAATLAGAQSPVVIMDVEGFEALLVDPLRIPELARTVLLIEYHDFILPGLSQIVAERLQPTHELQLTVPTSRAPSQLPNAGPWLSRTPRLCRVLLSERRPMVAHGWILARPRLVNSAT